jgi:hypothetical protein
MHQPDPRLLTDAALTAAVRTAIEVGLLPRVDAHVVAEDWERIRAVVRAALDAEAGPDPAEPRYAVRALYIPTEPRGEPVEAVMLRHADRAGAQRLAEELARLTMYTRVRVVEEEEG